MRGLVMAMSTPSGPRPHKSDRNPLGDWGLLTKPMRTYNPPRLVSTENMCPKMFAKLEDFEAGSGNRLHHLWNVLVPDLRGVFHIALRCTKLSGDQVCMQWFIVTYQTPSLGIHLFSLCLPFCFLCFTFLSLLLLTPLMISHLLTAIFQLACYFLPSPAPSLLKPSSFSPPLPQLAASGHLPPASFVGWSAAQRPWPLEQISHTYIKAT